MIDILMAVYNGETYLEQQIESILQQSCTDWRLLIHDDGSTDRTVALIEEYQERYPDKVQILQDGIRTGGAKNNFFHLLKHSDADYVMFADQDDVWEVWKVQSAYEQLKRVEDNEEKDIPILIHGDLQVVDSSLQQINASMYDMQKLDKNKNQFRDYLVQNNVTGCTTMINRALREKCLEMPEDAIMHDWWLALLASAFGRVEFMGESGILYRQHGHNTEGAKNLKSIGYLWNKVFQGQEIRNTLELTYRQAEAFSKLYSAELSEEKREILNAYLGIKNRSKWNRLKTIRRYGFGKSGVVRQIGYLFYV